ncbi:MAG: hypothetical protein H7067_05990, partial [Burkholderiales bacterium]|nr:hypothetical protein [Opitutaceae bacterium]
MQAGFARAAGGAGAGDEAGEADEFVGRDLPAVERAGEFFQVRKNPRLIGLAGGGAGAEEAELGIGGGQRGGVEGALDLEAEEVEVAVQGLTTVVAGLVIIVDEGDRELLRAAREAELQGVAAGAIDGGVGRRRRAGSFCRGRAR